MESKQRNGGTSSSNRRRRARMQKRQLRAAAEEASENEESPPARQKRPPARKKRIKEPIYQEDIVDGFAFLCFKTYEDLERTVTKFEKKSTDANVESSVCGENTVPNPNTDQPPLLEESPVVQKKNSKIKNNNKHPKVKKKNNCINDKVQNNKEPCLITDENSRSGEKILETQRGTSKDQLSDASSHASSDRGYMCDSESGDERGSEPECDLFNNTHDSNFIAKKANPGHSQTCRSPPVLPPIHPVQNGTRHPEPSTAVAAVTASASPTNTSSSMAVGTTSPREPQIGSPAVIPSSTSSPPPGIVPSSSPRPPFIPPLAAANKESASSSNKLLNNGYKFVSDMSVPSCRESGTLSKPAINVYDFVSDQSAPSSPEGRREILFLSQSKFHHKGVSPLPVTPTSKESPGEKVGVSNGHVTNLCVSALSPPVLISPVIQNCHKSALDMTIKTSVPSKTEQPAATSLPPVSVSGSLRIVTLPSPVHSAPSVAAVSPVSSAAAPISLRTTVSSSVTMSSSTVSHVLSARSRSPVVTASHPNTPTPIPARDTHSSHSNSSLSSLSQLSTPVHSKERDGASSRSHSNSSSITLTAVSTALTSTSAYASASSLTGLVFSKPHCWTGSSGTTNTMSVSAAHSSPIPPRTSPALSSSLPLPPTLPQAHHNSPFSSHPGPPPPPLLPVASHHAIFQAGPLTPTLPMEATAGPSSYRAAETLFTQPSEYKKHPDLLRRELDTRFLASQDHSIPIPPPPYMQSEVQHHSQMHQQSPFIAPPPLGAPMVSQPGAHIYEKYPKLESSLYRRSSMGLSGYPSVSSLFAPGGGASTPFVPPAHLAALQSKMNPVPKTKSMKPGKWCAMHVRIAWEIYNLQQKQKHVEAHKSGIALAAVKPPPDHLHPSNHPLFSSLPRQHELSPFSSSLISAAAASAHPRSFESSSHPSTFLNPTPAHLGPFTRPGYSGFPGTAPGFTSLGPLGIPGPTMLGADLRTGCIPQDPWSQRTGLPFAGGSPWGGLKEEAEREQRKREEERQKRAEQERREKEERERREQERREQERRELERQEQERKERERKEKERKEQERREMERREIERREQERREQERRDQERQRERDRELRLHHQLQKSSIIMNGEMRDHHLHHAQHHPHHTVPREWERGRDIQRSPLVPPVKYESGMERHVYPPSSHPKMEIKIKQERKDAEELAVPVSRSSRPATMVVDERVRKRPGSIPQSESLDLVAQRNAMHNSVAAMGLDPSRVMGGHGLVPSPVKDPLAAAHHSQTSPLWGPLTPSPTVTSMPGPVMEHYRAREMQGDPRGRFEPLVMSPRDTCAGAELSRQISNALDMERAAVAAYDRAKLLPPPLRTNESPYATPPTLPPASASSFFSPPVSPYLGNLVTTTGRTKAGPPPGMLNGLPPPLIPCTFPVQNHTGFPSTRTSPMGPHKLIPGSGVLNLPETYFPKDRREMNGHPTDFDAHLRL